MSDEAQLHREISRGQQAREVIEHPLYTEALEKTRQDLMQAWESSPARDTEGRERLWLAVSLLGKLEQHLKDTMQTGTMARLQLTQERTRMEALKDWATKWG